MCFLFFLGGGRGGGQIQFLLNYFSCDVDTSTQATIGLDTKNGFFFLSLWFVLVSSLCPSEGHVGWHHQKDGMLLDFVSAPTFRIVGHLLQDCEICSWVLLTNFAFLEPTLL